MRSRHSKCQDNFRFVEAAERQLEEWAQKQRAVTNELVRKYSELFRESDSSEEEEEEEDEDVERSWRFRHCCRDVWTDAEAEAMGHLAFAGYAPRSLEVESNVQLGLVIDTRGVRIWLKNCLSQVTSTGYENYYENESNSSDSSSSENVLSKQLQGSDDKKKLIWDHYMRKPLDECRSMIETLLNKGDHQNAAQLLVVAASLLCRSSTAVALVGWSDDDDACYKSKDYILNLLRRSQQI